MRVGADGELRKRRDTGTAALDSDYDFGQPGACLSARRLDQYVTVFSTMRQDGVTRRNFHLHYKNGMTNDWCLVTPVQQNAAINIHQPYAGGGSTARDASPSNLKLASSARKVATSLLKAVLFRRTGLLVRPVTGSRGFALSVMPSPGVP